MGIWEYGESGVWRYWNIGTWRHGDMGIWEYRNMGIWGYGDMGIWEYRNIGIWGYGDIGIRDPAGSPLGPRWAQDAVYLRIFHRYCKML